MEKKVRMADIAKSLGISTVSVSKALSGKDGVSDEMRESIHKKAQELGYIYPQKDSKSSHGLIGILASDGIYSNNFFYAEMHRSIIMQASELQYSAILDLVPQDRKNDHGTPNLLSRDDIDGLIIMGNLDPSYIQEVIDSGLPFVFLDFYDETAGADSITSDSIYGTFMLTNHLISLGHRDIRFVGRIGATSSIMDRFFGFTKAMMLGGLRSNVDDIINDRDEKGSFIPIPFPEKMPDAFVCNCDQVAFSLIKQLEEAGYHVPEDVSVVGFDDILYASLSQPQITTFRVDISAMVESALSLLINKIEKRHYTRGRRIISGEMIFRESTTKKK